MVVFAVVDDRRDGDLIFHVFSLLSYGVRGRRARATSLSCLQFRVCARVWFTHLIVGRSLIHRCVVDRLCAPHTEMEADEEGEEGISAAVHSQMQAKWKELSKKRCVVRAVFFFFFLCALCVIMLGVVLIPVTKWQGNYPLGLGVGTGKLFGLCAGGGGGRVVLGFHTCLSLWLRTVFARCCGIGAVVATRFAEGFPSNGGGMSELKLLVLLLCIPSGEMFGAGTHPR